MAKLLIVDSSNVVRSLVKDILDEDGDFDYELAGSYEEADELLLKSRYEFAVVDRSLGDAKNGEIIALLNKRNIAPLVFTKTLDEDFFEAYESAQIVEYIIKQDKYNNISTVVEKLKQLKANKQITILVVNGSKIYSRYLKQSLNLHNFKVITAFTNEEALEKLKIHQKIKLMILDDNRSKIDSLKLIQTVKIKKKFTDLKILILADETNSYRTNLLLNMGANDYLIKQFSRAEFYVRVYKNI